MIISITRVAGIGAVFATAAIGWASPVSAQPLSGTYDAAVTALPPNPALSDMMGLTVPATFTDCGPDCMHLQLGERDSFQSDLRLQTDDTWTGTRTTRDGDICTFVLDAAALTMTDECPIYGGGTINYKLTKAG